MDKKECDILILGAGPAGLTAGLYAARAGMKTVIIESMAAGGAINMTPDIANYPGFLEISGHELGEKMREQAEAAGTEIEYDEIDSIDLSAKVIRCATWSDAPSRCAGTISYKALIIATGAHPRKLGIEREEDFIGSGIHFCGLCDGMFYRDKDVIVVGGGNHAVEEAIYMSAIAKSVTMIVDIDKLTAQETLIKQLGKDVKIHFGSEIKKLLTDKKLVGVELKNGTTVNADGVFVAIGRIPNTQIFNGKIELSKGGYIKVNDKLQTNIADVFAAGDVTEKNVRQIITACADGAIAATHVAELLGSTRIRK